MKWVALKIYLFPSIMQEIEQVTETYSNYINEIKRTNSEKTIKEFEMLRESISNRVLDLEKFYENNIFDSRITSFEKARSKLKKLLKSDSDIGHDIDSPIIPLAKLSDDRNKLSNINLQKFTNNPSNKNKKVLETKKMSAEKIPSKQFGNSKNRTASTDVSKRLKLTKKEDGKDKLNNSMVEPKKKSSIQKIDANGSNLDLTNGKANIMKNSNTSEKKTKPVEKVTMPAKGNGNQDQGGLFNNLLGDGYLEFKDLAKWKEIVFKIKLTENEYKLLIKEKANIVNIK